LVDLVEVEQVLRLLVLHGEAFALQDNGLFIQLNLVETLQDLQNVLSLPAEDVPLSQHIDNLELFDPRFQNTGLVHLDKDVSDLHLYEEGPAAWGLLGGGR
jgi:hypothetical protein